MRRGGDLPHIVGFSDSVHDRSVCLFRGGQPLVAIAEERLTRRKHGIDLKGGDLHDPALFSKLKLHYGRAAEHEAPFAPLIDYCLDAAGIATGDVDLLIGNSLHLAYPFADTASFVNHHRAHAASAFYASGWEEASVLVIDGYGDAISETAFETVSIYRGGSVGLDVRKRVGGRRKGRHLSNSAGILYRIGTLLAGFGIVDEGKAMGLAAYGQPRHLDRIQRHIRRKGNEIAIDNDAIWRSFAGTQGGDFQERADIAASFQAILEMIVLHYARLARELVPSRRLCMAGGVALNCVANQLVLEQAGFEELFVFPAAADDGISFGAAFLGAHEILGVPRSMAIPHVNLGRSYSDHSAALALLDGKARSERCGGAALVERAATALAGGEIVMWFQDGSEFGPRALGNRSLLADPRDPAVRDHINAAVKSRETFRPLAPMIREEDCRDWFACNASPYMLFSPPALARTKSQAPAVVHVDGTARVQTVSRAANPKAHALLGAFVKRSGMPILLNTSFNIRGEPIVETPEDAVRAFLGSPVRVLCLDDLFIEKTSR